MNREEQFWKLVSEMTFAELMDISKYITDSAKQREEFDIYDWTQFAQMMSDYADAALESE